MMEETRIDVVVEILLCKPPTYEQRKLSRLKLLSSKRIRYDTHHASKEENFVSEEQIKEALVNLSQKKTSNRKAVLQRLRTTITDNPAYIESITKSNHGLPTLVGLLSGSDPELQLETAWCLTNMTANTNNHQASVVLKHAGPYLVTYLSSKCEQLQDQCAWTLGNIAACGVPYRETILSQGAAGPLIALLQSDTPGVVESAAFVLCNIVKDDSNSARKTVECGILPVLKSVTTCRRVNQFHQNESMVDVFWLIWYLTDNEKVCEEMARCGFSKNCTDVLKLSLNEEMLHENIQLLTPAVRSLGNLVSSLTRLTSSLIYSDGTEYRPDISWTELKLKLIECFDKCLNCDISYFRKETMWVLSNVLSIDTEFSELSSRHLFTTVINVMTENCQTLQEGIHCLYNLALHSTTICHNIVKEGILRNLLADDVINDCDTDVIYLILSIIKLVCESADSSILKDKFVESYLQRLTIHDDLSVQECAQEFSQNFLKQTGMEIEQNSS